MLGRRRTEPIANPEPFARPTPSGPHTEFFHGPVPFRAGLPGVWPYTQKTDTHSYLDRCTHTHTHRCKCWSCFLSVVDRYGGMFHIGVVTGGTVSPEIMPTSQKYCWTQMDWFRTGVQFIRAFVFRP